MDRPPPAPRDPVAAVARAASGAGAPNGL